VLSTPSIESNAVLRSVPVKKNLKNKKPEKQTPRRWHKSQRYTTRREIRTRKKTNPRCWLKSQRYNTSAT
jgi:hypothetical protein